MVFLRSYSVMNKLRCAFFYFFSFFLSFVRTIFQFSLVCHDANLLILYTSTLPRSRRQGRSEKKTLLFFSIPKWVWVLFFLQSKKNIFSTDWLQCKSVKENNKKKYNNSIRWTQRKKNYKKHFNSQTLAFIVDYLNSCNKHPFFIVVCRHFCCTNLKQPSEQITSTTIHSIESGDGQIFILSFSRLFFFSSAFSHLQWVWFGLACSVLSGVYWVGNIHLIYCCDEFSPNLSVFIVSKYLQTNHKKKYVKKNSTTQIPSVDYFFRNFIDTKCIYWVPFVVFFLFGLAMNFEHV